MLTEYIVPKFGENAIPPFYYTPPYLTAKPQIAHHHLQPRDKFLILATDGLWDFMSPLQVIKSFVYVYIYSIISYINVL